MARGTTHNTTHPQLELFEFRMEDGTLPLYLVRTILALSNTREKLTRHGVVVLGVNSVTGMALQTEMSTRIFSSLSGICCPLQC